MHFALTFKVYRTLVQFCIEINWQLVTLNMHFALTLKVYRTLVQFCIEINWQWVTLNMHFALTLKVYRTLVQFCIEINWQWVALNLHFALTLKVNQTGTIPCSCYLLIKNTQKVKQRMLFNETKQDRMHILEGIFFFKATNNTNTNNLAAANYVLPLLQSHEQYKYKQISCCRLRSFRRMCARSRWYTFLFVLFMALKKRIPSEICIVSCFV